MSEYDSDNDDIDDIYDIYDTIAENINRVVLSKIKDLDEDIQDEILERLQEQYRFYSIK